MDWGFYGRQQELKQVTDILNRGRWFFAKMMGRRRIGKTRLIQQALNKDSARSRFYVQVPDSAPAGVVSAFREQAEIFKVDPTRHPLPTNLLSVARFISSLIRAGYVVALDEFQYFSHSRLHDFCSFLQSEVDSLSNEANIKGGLFVLGSIHAEMNTILEDRSAPLYNRTTDEIELSHWDFSSILELLKSFEIYDPHRLLFLWNLFEGVPKFYRDCFEQNVLGATRDVLLKRMFFESSSPLRTEADNWFLKELHGRYDAILKYIARNAGCTHADILSHVRQVNGESEEQIGGHLVNLVDKFQLIEKKLPILASARERKGKYYLSDNFLRSWLAALAGPVSSLAFASQDDLIQQADERLQFLEGHSLERLVSSLYEERSRKKAGDFLLSSRIKGYWDRSDTEIDLVALSEQTKTVRFGTCKRNPDRLRRESQKLREHVARFLSCHPAYNSWNHEYVAISPVIDSDLRKQLQGQGLIPQDFSDLLKGL